MMESPENSQEFELICVIVNFGLGSKIIKYARQHGINGGTVFLGKGTVKSSILQLLEINEVRKEIVILAGGNPTACRVMDELSEKFEFRKPNHGIAFSTSISKILGTTHCTCIKNESKGVESQMYNVIIVIVDKGNAESVIEAAEKAGSRGGTIINARGAGVHETSKLFSMEIEPEKEIVLIISETGVTDKIAASIRDSLEMDKPGNGIMFIQEVNRAYGIY
jgi:nitrogen regulatory protein PII